MHKTPIYRHDPIRATTNNVKFNSSEFLWTREPVVCGYRKLIREDIRTKTPRTVPVSATPVIISGVGVIFTSDDGIVRFYDRQLKTIFWERRLNASIYASPYYDRQRQWTIVASTKGLVACFDLRGQTIWTASLGNPAYANPTLLNDGKTIVFSLFNSQFIGLNIETGEIRFKVDLPKPWHASMQSIAGYRDPYASPLATLEGHVIVCCAENVMCFSNQGEELWRKSLGHSIKASPVLIESTEEIFVCLVNGDCIFLSLKDGTLKGQIQCGSKITASPAFSNGIIVVGLQSDISVGISASRKQIQWRTDQGSPRSYTSFSTLPDENFICTNGRGNIISLSHVDGKMIWESSQVLGLPEHESTMDITPVADICGCMYGASYEGDLYYFVFSKKESAS